MKKPNIKIVKISCIIISLLAINAQMKAIDSSELTNMFSVVMQINNSELDKLMSEVELFGAITPEGLFVDEEELLLCLFFHDSHGSKIVLIDSTNAIHSSSELVDVIRYSFWYDSNLNLDIHNSKSIIVTKNEITEVDSVFFDGNRSLEQKIYSKISELYIKNSWDSYVYCYSVIGDTLYALSYDFKDVKVYNKLSQEFKYKLKIPLDYSIRYTKIIYKDQDTIFLGGIDTEHDVVMFDINSENIMKIENTDFTTAFNTGELLSQFEDDNHIYTWFNEKTFYVILQTEKGIYVLKYLG